ncbi:hypothetical protein MXD62_29150 [Frankia sp. Mgl5]|uniref:hypothetical protein n=1 Tax=Frankia sp. Mgl5 TaxID=2933793 RepID=UPI00200EDA73|nr:hypothetical protein [Frankia sp. Mgl5]MCK9931159.1 hypothetical protein [Frankia sp. Mgl5]
MAVRVFPEVWVFPAPRAASSPGLIGHGRPAGGRPGVSGPGRREKSGRGGIRLVRDGHAGSDDPDELLNTTRHGLATGERDLIERLAARVDICPASEDVTHRCAR